MGGGKGKNNANGFPFDRRRTLPMGISNSGVNCWYSSLSQLLFHIPAARRAIFDTQPYTDNDSRKIQCWSMCKELQLQFAIMQDRHQDSVSPIASLSAMNDLFPGDGVQYEQKDAVEIFTRLLSSLETITESASKESPLTEIFGGVVHDLKPDAENGSWQWHKPTGKKEIFSFPLNPGLGNLQSAMDDVFLKPEHERWIVEAAPVLLLPIARYTYDGGVVQKKNDRFLFRREIFLDRYMSANRDSVLSAKSQYESAKSAVASLRDCLTQLTMLNNPKLSWMNSVFKHFEFLVPNNWSSMSNTARVKKTAFEIRQQLNRYESMPNQLEGEEFKKIAYDLHVVIMHSGYAEFGHYYAYVRRPHNTSGSEWLCCDDARIREVSWSDVAREAYGRQSTSAFALLYIRRSEFDRLYDYEYLLNTNVDGCLLDPTECLPEYVNRMLQAHYDPWGHDSNNSLENADKQVKDEKGVRMPVSPPKQQTSERDQRHDRRNKLRDETSSNLDKSNESKNDEQNANDSGGVQMEMDAASTVTTTQPALPSITRTRKIRVAILISGHGRSIENLVNAARQPDSLYQVVNVYTNVFTAPGREMAKKLDVTNYWILDEQLLIRYLIGDRVDIICMDGFNMQLKELRELWREKIIDVHPTIYLEFWDNPYNGPISAGRRVTGCTFYRLLTDNAHPITIVDEEAVRVPDDATPDTLKEIIRSAAMNAYPRAVTRLAKEIIAANTAQ